MANPLAILGQIAGGLSGIGGQGAEGLFTGQVEGEKLKREFANQDQLALLRALRLQLEAGHLGLQQEQLKQKLGPQYHIDPQGRIIFSPGPGQMPQMAGELPMTATGQQRLDLLGAQTKLSEEKLGIAQQRLKLLEEGGGRKKTDLETYREFLGKGDLKGAQQFLDDVATVKRAEAAPAKPAQQLELPVRTQLMAAGINPETATPEQIKKATEDVDKRIATRTGVVGQQAADIKAGAKRKEQAEKDVKGLAGTETLLNQLEALIPVMEEKGFLAKNPSAISVGKAEAKRSRFVPFYGQPGDEDLAAWKAHAGTMVRILRDLGDIGPRAISAYQSAIDVIERPTTAAGARKVFEQLREAVKAQKSGQVGGVPGIMIRGLQGMGESPAPSAQSPLLGVGTGVSQPTAPGVKPFPPLPPPNQFAGQTVKWDPTGEWFKSDGVKWDRVPGPGSQPAGRGATGAGVQGGKRRAIGPDGKPGLLPADTDLGKYPDYRWAQ
jgi:hypothetical protein